MRYIFISDVHGQYDKMLEALERVSFNPETDTLVTLGDLFDRGPQSKEILDYVMALPNYIPIWGNHDWRLRELVLGTSHANTYDNSNGVPYTLQSFCGLEKKPSIYWGLQVLKADHKSVYDKLWSYFYKCSWAIEFPDLIGVHAWLPYHIDYGTYSGYFPHEDKYYLNKEWRTSKHNDWNEAVWAHTERMLMEGCYPDKNMIVGHWHAWRIAYMFGHKEVVEMDENGKVPENPAIQCTPYIRAFGKDNSVNIIFIDGCSNYENGGRVNAYVYESDAKPILYLAKGVRE